MSISKLAPTPLPIGELIHRRLTRRDALKGIGSTLAGVMLNSAGRTSAAEKPKESDTPASLVFKEIEHIRKDNAAHADRVRTVNVPEGYVAEVVAKWGDPVLANAPSFDPNAQTAEAQRLQFGYNNDFIAVIPFDRSGDEPDRALLCVNHEYTNAELMFAGMGTDKKAMLAAMTEEQVRIEMAAHGFSILEIRRDASGAWKPVPDGARNRRINALDTAIEITGPAAGHPRMQTSDDPTGRSVIGMINNCAGGVTPWGTVLSGEENFHGYFEGVPADPAEAANHARYEVSGAAEYAWHRFHPRYNVANEPHEPNRFGWIVEIDPYDLQSPPRKRTALGRFRHEGAATVINHDGRLVVYMGDDAKYEYIYKFISKKPYNPWLRKDNFDLLDDGTLFVARFSEDGTLKWLPLVHGTGPLTEAQGFGCQSDVLIETRRAASLVGATPMDRPEDIECNPRNHRVYVMLTNNDIRDGELTDAANPRETNKHGHVLELMTPMIGSKADHGALEQRWGIFLLAGDPSNPATGARYNPNVSNHGWLSCPDNMTFDNAGRIWISTDGAEKAAGHTDGVYVAETDGPMRALTRHFLCGPTGAEICGPWMMPDEKTLFVAIQHPGEGGKSTRDNPSTRWPNAPDSDLPPMPAVIAIRKADGGIIGT